MLFNIISRPDFIAYQFEYRCNVSCILCRLFGAEKAYWTITTAYARDRARKEGAAVIFQDFSA